MTAELPFGKGAKAMAFPASSPSPALMFERTTQSDDGRIVEFVRSVYRGDRYRIVTELSPPVSGQPEIVRAIDANGVSFTG